MSWNEALNQFIKIKSKFIRRFGYKRLWDYSGCSCIEYWVDELGMQEYKKMISPLIFNEFEDLLLIRYGSIGCLLNEEMSMDDLWNMFNGLYMECRSVVIDIKRDELVLTPFRKFRNINDGKENQEERIRDKIKNAKCVEFTNKLDGSMQSARWYREKLVVSGSQTLDKSKSKPLQDGYRRIAEDKNYMKFLQDYNRYTAIFEYISSLNRRIVRYPKEQEGMYLVGIREVSTGKELSYSEVISIANKYGLKTTIKYNMTFDEVMKSLNDKTGDEAEGYVLSIDGYKVKIKYNDFVNMHDVISEISPHNTVIKNIADDTWDDFISKIPDEYKEIVERIAKEIAEFIRMKNSIVNEYYNTLKRQGLKSTKEDMIWINNNVPNDYRSYVIQKYKNQEYNFLKGRTGKYTTMGDIHDFMDEHKNINKK